jgi:hypothetical protein
LSFVITVPVSKLQRKREQELIQVTTKNWRRKRPRHRGPVRIFRATFSSFFYNERIHQPLEFENYVKIARVARSEADIRRIRVRLEEKGRRHFRYWLRKHLNVHLDRRVQVNFEKEQRAERQIEQAYASVRRLMMRRIDRRWVAENLPSGKMSFAKKRRKHGRK